MPEGRILLRAKLDQSWSTDCEGLDLRVDSEELDWRADRELNKEEMTMS